MTRRFLALSLVLLLLAACGEESMGTQPNLRPYEASALWPDGTEARPLPVGVVARGSLADDTALAAPPPVTIELIHRGRRDYDEFCSPCHGLAGDGDGMIVQRGFSPPPSYHSARLRTAPAEHFVNVITNGFGAMYSYADRVPPEDRWAITAYIRALQMSREAKAADVPGIEGDLP